MSTADSNPPPDPNPQSNPEKQPEQSQQQAEQQDVPMDTTPDQPKEETWDDIPSEVMGLSSEEIMTRTRLIDNDIKALLH